MLSYVPLWAPSWIRSGPTKHIFVRGPDKDYYDHVLLQLEQWFLKRISFNVFPIGSNVNLCSPLAAILDEVRTCRTQFLKGTTQGLLWPYLVPIGPVVSEEKIFEWTVYDGRRTQSDVKSSPCLQPGELKIKYTAPCLSTWYVLKIFKAVTYINDS
jgi:hypothetical protein